MVADSYNFITEAGESQMLSSLVYLVSFWLAWATEQDSISETNLDTTNSNKLEEFQRNT